MTLATLTMFDFVVLFLPSNLVQNAIIGNDNTLLGGIIKAMQAWLELLAASR